MSKTKLWPQSKLNTGAAINPAARASEKRRREIIWLFSFFVFRFFILLFCFFADLGRKIFFVYIWELVLTFFLFFCVLCPLYIIYFLYIYSFNIFIYIIEVAKNGHIYGQKWPLLPAKNGHLSFFFSLYNNVCIYV